GKARCPPAAPPGRAAGAGAGTRDPGIRHPGSGDPHAQRGPVAGPAPGTDPRRLPGPVLGPGDPALSPDEGAVVVPWAGAVGIPVSHPDPPAQPHPGGQPFGHLYRGETSGLSGRSGFWLPGPDL